MTELKRCPRCEKRLPPTTEFWARSKYTKSGLGPRCKACERLRGIEQRRLHPDRVRENNRHKRETDPEGAREATRKWRKEHPEHQAEYRKANPEVGRRYRESHREELREAKRRWRQENQDKERATKHRRRASKANAQGSWSDDDVAKLKTLQKGKCWWCGKKFGQTYHIDHRIPLAQGGTNFVSNLVLSCVHCNTSKGAKLPQDFVGRLL